jgi:NAD(P)-dependent dehydrogenase (short-subunit alcohol dehydrogenase family)
MGYADELFDLTDRVVLITGGSRGLGREMAFAAAQCGADVIIASRKLESCQATAEEITAATGRAALPYQVHVGRWDELDGLVDAAYNRFGKVDVLINNAGIGTAVPATREQPDDFRRVIDINLNGSYWMAQACGRAMKDGGSIVNIGSVLGSTTAGLPQAAYAASKAAIIGLTRDLAQQWTGRKGIRVNALAPGFFASEMTDTYPDGYLDLALQRVPAGRKGDGAELAAALVFLASDAGGYVTGQTLAVDGGMTIA